MDSSELREADTTGLPIGDTPTEELHFDPRLSVLRVGTVVADRYRVEGYLGRGGFSTVYLAKRADDGDSVALKLMSNRNTDANVRGRMERELRLARDLRHPNIVRVHELLELEDVYCLAMEFVPGSTLKQRVSESGPLPIDEAVVMIESLSSALAAVHAGGIVHRDLKPQNVMITPDGTLKLLDFGLAKTPDSTGLTATGTILGTPDYMAPEQVDGKIADERSDLYSLGVIAFELLTGHPPFRADTPLATALQHVRNRVPDVRGERPEVPEPLSRLIRRLTDREPDKRPPSAAAVLADVDGWSRGDSLAGADTASHRRWSLRAAAAAAVVAVVALGGWMMAGRGGSSSAQDPFSDGRLEVSVSGVPSVGIVGGDLFLDALCDALDGRLPDATVRLVATREQDRQKLARQGVEHHLELRLVGPRTSQGSRELQIRAVVQDVASGDVWRELGPVTLEGLDFESIDVASSRLSSLYHEAVGDELARHASSRAHAS
jgi:hypothetical protein